MSNQIRLSVVPLVLLGLSMMGCSEEPSTASAELRNAEGSRVGTAEFTETAGGVRVKIDIADLPAGEYVFRIHEFASCQAPGFVSAGGPFPSLEEVGMVQNASPTLDRSLGELHVNEAGTGQAEAVAPIVTISPGENSLFHEGGTALIIENLTPAGIPGERVACGEITRVDGAVEDDLEGDLDAARTPDDPATPGKIYRQPETE